MRMPSTQSYVIQTTDLSKTYKRGPQVVTAINGLDLAVPKHSIFGFLGPNGAGKTTTMKILLGLARPTQGTITVFDKDHQDPSVRARIGYMPQSPRFYPNLTARQTLRFAARFYPQCGGRNLDARIEAMLELVGLSGRADRPVGGFSGGERQRLGLAQAQIHNPDLLILDEPAAALDPLGRHDVLRIMESLREQTTIFYSTHILDDVQQVSDTVAIINRGSLVAQGTVGSMLGGGESVYHLQFRGPSEPVYSRLKENAWVLQIDVEPSGSEENDRIHSWNVVVQDDAQAQAGILPVLNTGQDLLLIEFSRKKLELEQVFLDLVHGEQA